MSRGSPSEWVCRPELHCPDRKGGQRICRRNARDQRLPGLKITDEMRRQGPGLARVLIENRLDAQAAEFVGLFRPYECVERIKRADDESSFSHLWHAKHVRRKPNPIVAELSEACADFRPG